MPQDQHHYLPKIIQLRRDLHTNPELSGQEYKTVNRIRQFAEKHGKSAQIETFGETGFALIYQFSESGKTIAIRCELDALPIQEENQFSYKSVNAGVSHKCGHDGHMAIVSGLIFWLEAQPIQKGKVILLFQPAEETGKGYGSVVLQYLYCNCRAWRLDTALCPEHSAEHAGHSTAHAIKK